MHRPSEGMRRLAIVIGVVASIAWIIFVVSVALFSLFDALAWSIFLAGIPICFGLGFLLIWGIDWVIAGFRQAR
jgi:hypothetical protein